jgi:uncharacterized membrane protein
MKILTMAGVVLVLLGVLSFVVPVPQRDTHAMKIGDAKISVETEHSEKLPPAVGIVLIVGGIVTLAIGLRKS